MGCGCAKRPVVGGRMGRTVGFVCMADGEPVVFRDDAPRVFADVDSAVEAAAEAGITIDGTEAVIV